MYAVAAVAVAVLLVVSVYFARSSLTQLADDGCLACGGAARHAIAPGVYRCAECGYEGGPGVAALRDDRYQRRHAPLDAAARTELVLAHLDHARVQLTTAIDRLEWIGVDILEQAALLASQNLGLGGDSELPEVERPTLEALESIASAGRELADARLVLRSGPSLLDANVAMPAYHGPDDPDAPMLLRARRAHRAAQALLLQVDAILSRD